MPHSTTPFSLDQNVRLRLGQLDPTAAPDFTALPTFDQPGFDPWASVMPMASVAVDQPPDPAADGVLADPDNGQDLTITQGHRIHCAAGDVWVSGSALLCRCPDCEAPMTIRLWLELADCWRCPTSIQLSAAQVQAAQQLARRQRPATVPPPPPPSLPAPPRPALEDPWKIDLDHPPAESLSPHESELERLSRGSRLAHAMRNGFSSIPAWLVSFLLHLVVILILALIMLGDRSYLPSTITLSTFLGEADETGGDIRIEDPTNSLRDDLEVASEMEIADEELRKVLQKANVDAQQLQVDPSPVVPLPDLTEVKRNITTARGPLMSFSARDPRVRAEMVRKEGGTTITEAAVSRGLRWLASVQSHDGGWSLRDYRRHDQRQTESDSMGTSLALLPMLGAGQTHEFGRYKENVARGLAWLLEHQKPNGDLRGGDIGNAGMYAHGQATIVLCEALALTGDQTFLDPAQRAIKFIEAAQHGKGGWRYQPGDPGDTSVFGWQMMALQSAKASGGQLQVDAATLKLADYFLDLVAADARFDNRRRSRLPEGSAYGYLPGREATPTMTAEAILCRIYLGWKKNDPRLDAAVRWLVEDHLPSRREPNLYYWYYGTQVMHHYGGKHWETWNDRTRGLLIASQEQGGRYPGSWNSEEFEWGARGGRIYTTSLAVCTLEVYYRHLPIFHSIELDR